MNNFINGLVKENNSTLTTNGAVAQKSTLNANLDFYGVSGNIGMNRIQLSNLFNEAYAEDSDLAIRNLLNMRDVRGGKGVRDNARSLLRQTLTKIDEDLIPNLLSSFVEVGRYDDLLAAYGNDSKIDNVIENLFIEKLVSDNPTLVAKWTPLNQKDDVSKKFMSSLRKKLGFSPKQMRKYIVEKRNVVETKMCANQWGEIDYSKVPSQAMRIYNKAFGRQDEARFNEFLTKVENGEVEIKASTLFPHEVTGNSYKTISKTDQAQWKALPDYIKEGVTLFPMIDVSGSMETSSYGNYDCMDIAIGLGLYLSERNKSSFKDAFLTFDTNPEIVRLNACTTLQEKKTKTSRANWGGSTDVGKAFELILNTAVDNKLTQEDLPDYLIVLSDMQFNAWSNESVSKDVIDRFEKLGYKAPKMIWWNLRASHSNVPVTFDEEGNALISGFSPSVMTSVLSDELEQFTPLNVMLQDLMQDRYNINTEK